MAGGGTSFISGPGTVLFDFTISASGGDGGPYTFNVGFGDQVGFSVNFQLSLTVPNGGTAASFANGGAHDNSGNSGASNSAFYQLISNPI